MPVYRLVLAGEKHIVIANLASQAIRHVTRKAVTCESITAEELANEIADGYRIEKADLQGADTAAAATGQMYTHKKDCLADAVVPIGVHPCICPQLDM